MALRNILIDGDPMLRKVSRKVDKFDDRLKILLDDMKDTLKESGGIGLAAPQVGVLKRVIIVNVEEDDFIEIINPVIVETKGEQREYEGCLSCPHLCGETLRPQYVKIEGEDRFGKKVIYEGEGVKARVFCHEVDHLDGILFKDHARNLQYIEE